MRASWASVLIGAAALLWPSPPPSPAGVDLGRFGELPVLHEGRLKPLETVARSSLLMLRGRQTVRAEGRSIGAVEWLLEVLARPREADRRAVFRVENADLLGFLGAERLEPRDFSFAELAPRSADLAEQAGRAARLEPSRRSSFETSVVNLEERLETYQRLKNTLALEDSAEPAAELDRFAASGPASGMEAERYRFIDRAAIFRPVPPGSGGESALWRSEGAAALASSKEPLSASARLYARLLEARRAGDSAVFNEVAGALTALLERSQGPVSRRARWEAWFDRAEPFYRGMIAYVAVFLLALGCFSERLRPRLSAWVLGALCVAALAHTAGLAARVALQGRPPVTNLYSSAVFVGWTAAVLGLWLEATRRDGLGALASSAVGFATLLIAHHLSSQGDTMEMMRAVLDSNFWLSTHVVTITIGYGAMFLAAALAHAFILRRFFSPGELSSDDRALASGIYGVLCAALFFSFVGTVLGGIWADQSWGRFWGWDPKENGALLIVLWVAVVLHARWGGYARERGLAAMAVFGAILTSLSWFGVNMLGVGLHSYGFMDKALPWLGGFVAGEFGVMGLAYHPDGAPTPAGEYAMRRQR